MPESNLYFEVRLTADKANLDEDLILVAHPRGGINDEQAMSLRELSKAVGGSSAPPLILKGTPGVYLMLQDAAGVELARLVCPPDPNQWVSSVGLGFNALGMGLPNCANTAMGSNALGQANGANNNCAFGNGAGLGLVTGNENCIMGYGAMGGAGPNASANNVIGRSGLNECVGGGNNGMGYQVMQHTTTGGGNCAFGTQAGFLNTVGNNNTWLGSGAAPAANNLDNSIALGASVTVPASNTGVIGAATITDIYFGSSAAPNAKIHAKQARFTALPTVVTGLPAGTLWNNAGIVNIAP